MINALKMRNLAFKVKFLLNYGDRKGKFDCACNNNRVLLTDRKRQGGWNAIPFFSLPLHKHNQ